jgi:hypothetical protein
MSPLGYFCATGNIPAINFLLSRDADVNYGYDRPDGKFKLRPVYHAFASPEALALLVAHGLQVTDTVMKKACLESMERRDVRIITSCLEAGGNLHVAQEAISKLVTSNPNISADDAKYVTSVTAVFKEYDEKKKAGSAVKPQTRTSAEAAADPNEVVIETTVMGRRLYKCFNFASQECISVIRKGPEAPVESHETKRFCDLLGQPDLKKAFAEHQSRGGTMTEDDIHVPAPSNKAPARCILTGKV